MTMSRKTLVAVGAAAALGLAVPSPARAALLLATTVNGVNYCAVDNDAFVCGFGTQITDTDPTAGSLALGSAGSPVDLNGLIVSGSLHTATVGALNVLNSSSLNVTNSTGGDITAQVSVSATDFTGPVTQYSAAGSGTWQTAAGSSIDMSWFNDPTNDQGAETSADRPGNMVHSFAHLATNPLSEAFSTDTGLQNLAVPDPALFSMTVGFDFTLVSGGELISRGQTLLKPLAAVPEPASLALFGLAAIAFARKRRQ